jgi:DNA adenine methylase
MAALKGAAYTAVRAAFNRSAPGTVRSAMFWFLREFAYGGMFRTNSAGGFNVPYGGISYNARGMAPRFEQMASPGIRARLARCGLHCGDFEAFLDRARLRHDDFVFLDPPYDSAFSTYDGNAFTRADHCRLAGCMARMPAKWMLVIAATDFVRETYAAVPGARTVEFGKTYQGHILNRNDRGAVYLMITNYGIPAPDCARRGTERLQGRLQAAGELADGMPA